jgi:uncharacterized protein YdeI (YjbR/CyaY-like superfamily)
MVTKKGMNQIFQTRKTNISKKAVHKLPSDLKNALNSVKNAITAWNDITPLARNEFICWILDAKKPETRIHRIERTCNELIQGKRRPCCWPGCPHR